MSNRDEEFVEFVQPRLPSLRRAAFLLCGDWVRGDDLVQRALTDAFVGWGRLRRADNPDAYLRAILAHRFADERRGSWARVALTEEIPDRVEASDDIDRSLDVHAALARLTERQRAVLVLRFLCDLSVVETAEALGCAEGTVKSQTSVALDAMRRHLGTVWERS